MPDIVVHHLEQSRSLRLVWLLEELGLAYELQRYARTKGFRAPPELAAVHRLGKAPVLVIDGDVLVESGAMFEEVLDRFGEGRLRPAPSASTFRDYRYWLHYAEGSLPTPLVVKLIADRVASAPVPFFLKPVVKRIAAQIDGGYSGPELDLQGSYLDDHLAERTWFTGDDFTAVDILLSYPLGAAVDRAGWGSRTNITAWLARCRARPAFQRAVERAGA